MTEPLILSDPRGLTATLYQGDALAVLRTLPAASVHCVVTSPPYWGLRDYGTAEWAGGDAGCDHKVGNQVQDNKAPGAISAGVRPGVDASVCRKCGARRIDAQLGLEPTPEEYVNRLVEVFREVRRVLRGDGCVWLNLGDSYASAWACKRRSTIGAGSPGPDVERGRIADGLKEKDLAGIPWRVAFALQADGWWLRQDIIWCLSGGTRLYVRTPYGDRPMTIKDLARLDPATVQLWNGEKWTQLRGMSRSSRRGDEIELVLRSGERIACTPTHRFPTQRGTLPASEIVIGDVLQACRLPEPACPRDCVLDADAAWLAGLYIAEGSRSGDTLQISGHAKETGRWERVQRTAAKFGGSATHTVTGNNMNIRIYGKVPNAIIDELVTGRTAKDKGFSPVVWQYSDDFLAAMLDGYLSGDGHKDGNRWRLGFTRNYNLERDLRTACARLGYKLTLNLSSVDYNGQRVPTFRGELRKETSGYHTEKERGEVVAIHKARCREVYDLGVADEPHLFALASGVLAHNSKPNPMPESVTDRCTKAHEYIFLLTKAARYFYDAEAVKEESTGRELFGNYPGKTDGNGDRNDGGRQDWTLTATRNRRSVWTIATTPYPGAHFATFPPELVRPCIRAGTSERGCCPVCGAPWERVAAHTNAVLELSAKAQEKRASGLATQTGGKQVSPATSTTLGFRPTCDCPEQPPIPCTVLDPFAGSGTTGMVAWEEGRHFIGIDLNGAYRELQEARIMAGARLL